MKIEVGDVFQIETLNGMAFLQYVGENAYLGQLIRVFPELGAEDEPEMKEMIAANELFLVHFPLKSAFNEHIVKNIGNYNLPPNFIKPQFMRDKHVVRGEFLGWHIVNVDTFVSELVKKLTVDQKRLSPWGIWNDTLLVERLSDGWTLDNWK